MRRVKKAVLIFTVFVVGLLMGSAHRGGGPVIMPGDFPALAKLGHCVEINGHGNCGKGKLGIISVSPETRKSIAVK